jgi:hypothetical protein
MDFLGLNVQYRAGRLATSAPKYQGTDIVKFGATLAGAERPPPVRRRCQRRRSTSLRSVLSLAPKWHNFVPKCPVPKSSRRYFGARKIGRRSSSSRRQRAWRRSIGAVPYGAELANVGAVVVWRRYLE